MTTLTQTVRPLPLDTEKETRVGNYFVANYPPFSFWTPEQVGDLQHTLDQPPKPGTPLGLYIHIPFCRRRCHFCYFKVYTDKNAAQIQGYIDAILAELELYAKRAFLGGRRPQFVYFGGGTPSYLSAQQLKSLTDGLKAIVPWDGVEEVTFEAEPGTLNEKKLVAIRELGVTRLSLGVENFSDHVLEANNRAHLSKQVQAAYGWSRAAGFPQINIDLIAGMIEETQENWITNVAKTIEMRPDCVTIYQMEVPFNTTIFKEMKEKGQIKAPVADWDTKRRWVKYAFDELEKHGYTITSAYTAVRDPAKTRFVYRDSLWRGADLLALGVASFGHIQGVHYQNEKDFEPYQQTVARGELPVHRAMRITDEEAMIREFILQMKTGRVSAQYFRDKFGQDVLARFAAPLSRYERTGFLHVDPSGITLDRDALLQVDTMLHEFFLPQHHHARYT
jgi:oxygen-independent coproporphyrinogen-3 oxidase